MRYSYLAFLFIALLSCKSNKVSQEPVYEANEENGPAAVEMVEEDQTVEPGTDDSQEELAKKHKPNYSDSLFFQIAKTPCFGQCPVYEVNIFQSGYATLYGKRFFKYEGSYTTKFTTEEMESIVAKAKALGYFAMGHVYDAPVTDLPSTTTVIQTESEEHWIYNRMNSPDELREFEKFVQKMVEDHSWTVQKKSPKE